MIDRSKPLVLPQLALACSWRPPRGNQYVPKCKARLVDLDQPRPQTYGVR